MRVPSIHCDSRVQTVCADVMKLPRQEVRALSPQPHKGFSVILSDMCPLVSGITTKDAALSMELGMRALDLAIGRAPGSTFPDEDVKRDEFSGDINGVLRPGGHLVLKLLESEDIQEFTKICKPIFRKASWLRPKATRSSSREIYLICQSLQS